MRTLLAVTSCVLASISLAGAQSLPRSSTLPDGTALVVRTDYLNTDKLPGYDQVKARAQGTLVGLVLEFTAKANPQLNFIIGRQADTSDFSLIIGEMAYPPVAVGGPTERLDRVQFAGYQYRTDDGRTGYQTFLSGKKELLLLFDVPSDAKPGSRSLSMRIRVGGKDAAFNIPLK